jgi:hypothetical protein
MNARAKTFGSPSGEPSTTRPYASTNVRKTLDTTKTLSDPHVNVKRNSKTGPPAESGTPRIVQDFLDRTTRHVRNPNSSRVIKPGPVARPKTTPFD